MEVLVLPFGDGTGPEGKGPTGWRRGPCQGKGSSNLTSGSRTFGLGRGFGRGAGRGFGFGRRVVSEPVSDNLSKEDRIKQLKAELKALENE